MPGRSQSRRRTGMCGICERISRICKTTKTLDRYLKICAPTDTFPSNRFPMSGFPQCREKPGIEAMKKAIQIFKLTGSENLTNNYKYHGKLQYWYREKEAKDQAWDIKYVKEYFPSVQFINLRIWGTEVCRRYIHRKWPGG